MQTYTYKVLIHPADEGETGFWAEVPALSGCYTQGETIEECMEGIKEAIALYLEVLVERGQPIPEEPKRDENTITSFVKLDIPLPA
jgi:predicted RNase H-like HicB family nuclease